MRFRSRLAASFACAVLALTGAGLPVAHAEGQTAGQSARLLAAAWAPWTAYATGAVVTYNGVDYVCLQGHTSQPGWEPP
ncbi:carbohydrate-binding protein, partial [Nonomuraea wenchangensis]